MATIVDFTEAPPLGKKTVLLFWAPWHEDSAEGGSMDQILRALAQSSTDLCFGRVQAEQVTSLSENYQITVVPTFIFLNENGKVVDRVDGGDDVAGVTQAVQRLAQTEHSTVMESTTESDTPMPSAEEQLTKRLNRLIRSSEVMLFMKGVPTAPRCGFSRQIVEMLNENSISFGSFDILTDEIVRQGLKKHSDWPTFPQLYVKGDLIGGLDIVKEMNEEGDLAGQLGVNVSTAPVSLNDRLEALTKRNRVMLFMKGLPSAAKCGFSRKTVELLEEEGVSYDSFDILTDEEVRQGLKKFSNWPTFPQLYVDGELIGGLDILTEMKEDGSLADLLKSK